MKLVRQAFREVQAKLKVKEKEAASLRAKMQMLAEVLGGSKRMSKLGQKVVSKRRGRSWTVRQKKDLAAKVRARWAAKARKKAPKETKEVAHVAQMLESVVG